MDKFEFKGYIISDNTPINWYWIPIEYTKSKGYYVTGQRLFKELTKLGISFTSYMDDYLLKYASNNITDHLKRKYTYDIKGITEFKGYKIGNWNSIYYWIPGEINNVEPGHGYYIYSKHLESELKQYGLSLKDYYDRYIDSNNGVHYCENCGKLIKFKNMHDGYLQYCSRKCNLEAHLNSGHITGVYRSPKCKSEIKYKSYWELCVCKMLDSNNSIKFYGYEDISISYTYNNQQHSYYPDFIIYDDNYNIIKIIEVKPVDQLTKPKIIAKLNSLKIYCFNHNITYEIWTEDVIDFS